MLAIFDSYDDATRELMQSLRTADIAITTVIVGYHGELPDEALCPFTTYTGIERTGSPLFFDEVPVPAWCEIRQGQEPYGEILRDGSVLGRIFYEPTSFREVVAVDWLLPDGTPGHTDHYDRYGNKYATTHFSAGVVYQTVYRGPGEWEIEVDRISRVVTMRSPDRLLTFATLTDFVSYFIDDQRLEAAGRDEGPVLINSLSHPLLVMRQRATQRSAPRSTPPRTTLFWQEPMPGDIPGNMATELEQPVALTRIVFSDERLREKVAARHPGTALELAHLSHLGQFAEKGDYEPKRAFTLTNTDELPALVELLEAFPDVTFSVAALTLMSERLHALGRRYPNLVLLPTVNHKQIREELDKASVYLDINAGTHVLDVVRAAYHLDLVVLALAPHAKSPDHSRVLATTDELKAALTAVISGPQERARALDELHRQRGPLLTPADYRRLLGRPPAAAERPEPVDR